MKTKSQDWELCRQLQPCVLSSWSEWPLRLWSDLPRALSTLLGDRLSHHLSAKAWEKIHDEALLLMKDSGLFIENCSQPDPLSEKKSESAQRQPTNIWAGQGLASPKIMDQVTWIIEHFWDKKIKLAPSVFLSMHFKIDSIRYWPGLYICFFSRGRLKLLGGRGISLIGNPKYSFYLSQQCIQNRILFYLFIYLFFVDRF